MCALDSPGAICGIGRAGGLWYRSRRRYVRLNHATHHELYMQLTTLTRQKKDEKGNIATVMACRKDRETMFGGLLQTTVHPRCDDALLQLEAGQRRHGASHETLTSN